MLKGASHARPGRAGSLLILLSVMLLAGAGVVYLAESVGAASVIPSHVAGSNNDGKWCADVIPGSIGLENLTASGSDGTLSVTIVRPSAYGPEANSFDWTSNIPVLGVVVKDGVDGANFYDYRASGSMGDTYLTTPGPTFGGTYKGISHINFCYMPSLAVSKTAVPTYTRTYTWAIAKAVTPSSFSGAPGGLFSSEYDVVVDRTVVDSAFAVSGTITIANNTSSAATVQSVTDSISGVGSVSVVCGVTFPYVLSAGGQLVCTYQSALPNADSRTNTATVTTRGAPGGGTATAQIVFGDPTTVVGFPTINVTDSVQGALGSASDDKTFEYTDDFVCPPVGEAYQNGVYAHSFPNTATIDETGQSDNANVDIRCSYDPALTASKTANATYTRTYTWTIAKAVAPSSFSGAPGDLFSSDCDVVVDRTVVDSAFALSGTIQVNNPTPVAVSFSVSDSVGGTATTVVCPTSSLAPGASTTCTYSASLGAKTNGTNTATITSLTAGVNGTTATAGYVFGDPTTVVGFPTINVTDSVQGALGSASDDKTFEYTDDFVCPPVGEAYQNGVYAHSFPNTATIDETGQSDNANVDIRCSYEVPGRIIVRKITLPAGAPAESFRFDPSWGADFSLANGGSADSGLLPPAVYSVAELLSAGQIDAGWSLTSATCSDGSLPSAIGLSPQETVTCTFVNTFEQTEGPKGSLTIIKVATPLLAGGATQFPFASSLGNFSLADGDSEAFTELDPGAYLVSETLPASANEDAVWKFDAIECTAGSFSVDEDNYSVTVNLAEGEAAVCTFYNHEEKILGPTGSLTIVKQTVPEGGEGFEFDAGDLGTFTLDDDGSVVFNDLEAGAYTVIEFAAEGWAFAQVECTALDWSQSGASVTVNLEEGEAATCTFTNGQLPYTGSQPFMLPLLIAGLWSVLMGLGLVVSSAMKRNRA